MKIWAHTLVKNEAQWLWYSVSSVINHIDKILLWDTGSTDGTLEIIKELQKAYPGKIEFKERKITSAEEFTVVRQEMLDVTDSDWFLILDGDEIWFEDSIKKVVETIKEGKDGIESIVVPTINLVGDIFHFQPQSAGRYKFGDKVGHYALRGVKRSIPGLHSQGGHGVWGFTDENGKVIQDRNTYKIIDAQYLHTTNLRRSIEDTKVIKRAKKYRYEIGNSFPKDFYYPEVFFRERPANIPSPWAVMSKSFKLRALIETPLRKIKRKVWKGKAGY